jgi:endonuclease/exonuclease/phosphatase family metal-dependent hydrolase
MAYTELLKIYSLDIYLKLYLFVLGLTLSLSTGCSMFTNPGPVEQRTAMLEVLHDSASDRSAMNPLAEQSTIKVLSLNLAHGRKDSFNQIFVSEDKTRENLGEIAGFLKRENADIITLQEADKPSSWSGYFDHVEFLAREADYPWHIHASHSNNWIASSGTAVMSYFPIVRGYGIDFNPTPPSTRKGFTLAEIDWNPGTDNEKKITIDVISVHLDFLSRTRRIEQIKEMTQVLGGRANPVIVVGDFNSGWVKGDQELQAFANDRNLKAYHPEADHLNTYSNARLDWILISEEFIFCKYYNATDILSDHLAVISELRLINAKSNPGECGDGQ